MRFYFFLFVSLFVLMVCILNCEKSRSVEDTTNEQKSEERAFVFKCGKISFARWKDDKRSAFTIYSDDGMIRSIKSQWTLENTEVPYDGFYRLGEKYNIPVTFFIDPRQIEDARYEPLSSLKPGAQPAGSGGTWADWKFMHDQGHEIASHTYSHAGFCHDSTGKPKSSADPLYEFKMAMFAIEKHIGEKPISLNFPYGRPTEDVILIARQYYPLTTVDFFDDTLDTMSGFLRSEKTIEYVEDKLHRAIKEGKFLLMGSHSIRTELGRREEAVDDFIDKGKRYDGYKPVEPEVVEALFQMLYEKRDSLFIDVLKNVGRYIKERNNSKIEVIKDTPEEVIFTVQHQLNSEVFVFPLTLKLNLLQKDKSIKIFQNGSEIKVTEKEGIVLFDVVPNRGKIVIKL